MTGGNSRVKQALIRWSPVLAAIVLSVVSWLSLPGYYCPDTSAFIAETQTFGNPSEWHVISPLYPMILDGLGRYLPAEARVPALVALQLLIAVVGTSLSLLIGGNRLGNPRAGWWAAWAATLYGPTYLLAHSIQTEALFIGLTAFTFLFAAGALQPPDKSESSRSGKFSRRLIEAALAGVIAGVALTLRSVGLATLMVIPCILLWFALARRSPTWKTEVRRSLAVILTMLVGAAVVIGAMKIRNGNVFGESSLLVGKGLHFHNRICYQNSFPSNPYFDQVSEIAKRHGVENPAADNGAWNVFAALQKDGMSRIEADRLMLDASKAALLDDPLVTAKQTLHVMARSARWNHPFNEYGTIFMADGIRPEHFDSHIETARFWWKDSPELTQGLAAVPPYPSPGRLGPWAYLLFEGLAFLGGVWSGWWVVAVGLLGFVYGVIRRQRVPVFGFGIAMAILGASALGEAPQIRFWAVCVPFFLLGLAGLVIGMVRARSGS